MKNYTGKCEYCGMEMGVMAESQKQANEIASKECDCGGGRIAEKKKMLMVNIEDLCGPECAELGFRPVGDETLQLIQRVGCMVVEARLQNATVKVDGTEVSIKGGEKIKVKRKYTYEKTGEVE